LMTAAAAAAAGPCPCLRVLPLWLLYAPVLYCPLYRLRAVQIAPCPCPCPCFAPLPQVALKLQLLLLLVAAAGPVHQHLLHPVSLWMLLQCLAAAAAAAAAAQARVLPQQVLAVLQGSLQAHDQPRGPHLAPCAQQQQQQQQ
jgi:hypothetical protein